MYHDAEVRAITLYQVNAGLPSVAEQRADPGLFNGGVENILRCTLSIRTDRLE